MVNALLQVHFNKKYQWSKHKEDPHCSSALFTRYDKKTMKTLLNVPLWPILILMQTEFYTEDPVIAVKNYHEIFLANINIQVHCC